MRKYIYFCIIAVVFSLNNSVIHAETIKIMMKTSAGEIGLELYPEKAPITVKNFLKYVDNGYYEGGTFYRVVRADNQVQNKIKIGVIQGGMGKDVNDSPFAPIPHETTKKPAFSIKTALFPWLGIGPARQLRSFSFVCRINQIWISAV